MAPPLMQLPGYRMDNALLNFSGLNEGIDSYRQGKADVRNALIQDEKLGMQRESHVQDMQTKRDDEKYKFVQRAAGQAQAIDTERDPAKRAQMWQGMLASDPRWATALQGAGVDPNDHATGPKFVINAARGYVNPLDDKAKLAEINLKNQHAGYYGDARKLQNAKADAYARPVPAKEPVEGYGMDEDNNLIPLQRGERLNPLMNPNPGGATPTGPGRFSPSAARSSVLGSETTLPGTTVSRDIGGTEIAQYSDPAARQRLIRDMEDRRALNEAYGEAPKGMRWNKQGGLEDLKLKDTATERAGRSHAISGVSTLQEAEKLLKDKNTFQLLMGDTYKLPGGFTVGGFGEAGRGFRAADSAVLQLNFALSGKSVSNAEREHFQRLYMPTATDSEMTRKWKTGQMKTFFDNVLQARKRGMDDDRVAEMYRQALAEGERGAPEDKAQPAQKPAMPSGNYRYDPATGQMVPK